jgi:hypothetical protein
MIVDVPMAVVTHILILGRDAQTRVFALRTPTSELRRFPSGRPVSPELAVGCAWLPPGSHPLIQTRRRPCSNHDSSRAL